MTKRNAKALEVSDSIATEGLPPGAIKYFGIYKFDGVYGMHFTCPCGCGAVHGVHFPAPAEAPPDVRARPTWEWNGDRARPSLTPSLGLHVSHHNKVGPDGKYHWHGYLTDGEFVEC